LFVVRCYVRNFMEFLILCCFAIPSEYSRSSWSLLRPQEQPILAKRAVSGVAHGIVLVLFCCSNYCFDSRGLRWYNTPQQLMRFSISVDIYMYVCIHSYHHTTHADKDPPGFCDDLDTFTLILSIVFSLMITIATKIMMCCATCQKFQDGTLSALKPIAEGSLH